MNQTQTKKFGLITTIAMIVGIVIGSGIFFKTDDILIQTNGSVLLGCLAWLFGAVGIIFGGLSVSVLAEKSDEAGGIVTYMELVGNKTTGFLTGWFLTIIYYPALNGVISWVAALYTCLLFGIEPMSATHWMIAIGYLIGIALVNAYATKLAGVLQSTTMFIKLIPLILIAVIGLLFGNPGTLFTDTQNITRLFTTSSAAIVSVAFAFDGWLVAPSICHEVKNAKRNIPLALVAGPIFIMVVYLSYFVGMTSLLGPERIMALGDAHIYEVANLIFGGFGAKLILIFVVISVLGTVNGLYLALARMPYALALRKELPFHEAISTVHPKFDMPLLSCLIALLASFFWLAMHYLTTKVGFLSQLDVSSLPIVLTYLFYAVMYVGIIRQTKQGMIKDKFRGYVCPILSLIGSAVIIYSGFQDPMAATYLIISIVAIFAGLLIKKKHIIIK